MGAVVYCPNCTLWIKQEISIIAGVALRADEPYPQNTIDAQACPDYNLLP